MSSQKPPITTHSHRRHLPAAVPQVQHQIAQKPHVRVLHINWNRKNTADINLSLRWIVSWKMIYVDILTPAPLLKMIQKN